MVTDCNAMDNTTIDIANDIWCALADAATVELSIKPFYDEVLKNEDKPDFKKPSEFLLDKYKAVVPKTNWSFNVKYILLSIKMAATDKPICLWHLLMYAAKVKEVFGDCSLQDSSCYCKLSS
jgi:hypothetical protein